MPACRASGESAAYANDFGGFYKLGWTLQVEKRPRAWFGGVAPGSPGAVRDLLPVSGSWGPSQVERRRSVRYPLKLPVVIVAAGGSSMNLPAHTCNISSTGVLLHCSEELAVAQGVEYLINLYPDNNLKLRCKGRVLRSARVLTPLAGTAGAYNLALTVEKFDFIRQTEGSSAH